MGEGPEGNKGLYGRSKSYLPGTAAGVIVVGANPRRTCLTLKCLVAAVTIGLGDDAVTTLASNPGTGAASGYPMSVGEILPLRSYIGAVAAIGSSASAVLCVVEEISGT